MLILKLSLFLSVSLFSPEYPEYRVPSRLLDTYDSRARYHEAFITRNEVRCARGCLLESLIPKRSRVLDSFQDQGYPTSQMHIVSGITGDLRIPVSAL